MLEKVIENWTSRLDYIRASRGSPMPEIIFKMKKWVLSLFSLGLSITIGQLERGHQTPRASLRDGNFLFVKEFLKAPSSVGALISGSSGCFKRHLGTKYFRMGDARSCGF
ncbi:hypothetical protein TNCV_41331 [Trichonephila clavipes]|nr:hypothetical protein TNCV_41331 [Trichonephila clavipes]